MKSFTTLAVFAVSTLVANAQVTYNETTGVFTCPASNPNGAYCAGDSLTSNIIIRCTDGVGHPGNCNDNLAGFPPLGVNYAPCWESSTTSGDAACSKNCIVQAEKPFTLPDCTPVVESSTSSATIPLSTGSSIPLSTGSSIPLSTGGSTFTVSSTVSGSTTITSTYTSVVSTANTIKTLTFTTTYCPPETLSTTYVYPAGPTGTGGSGGGSPSGSAPNYPNNGTNPNGPTATKTPVGPSTTFPGGPAFTGAAVSNQAFSGVAAIGLAIAYFL